MAIRIYIDQGHNPVNPNAGAEGNGLREQDLVYTIGQLLYERLEANPDFTPKLSRTSPTQQIGSSNASSLRIRVEQANQFGADLFLSLHTNASVSAQATGVEGLVYRIDSTAGRIAEQLLRSLSRTTGLRNRGVKARPGLYVLKRTAMPAVLLELGFITNSGDAALMARNPELFADGIYQGLRTYYGV